MILTFGRFILFFAYIHAFVLLAHSDSLNQKKSIDAEMYQVSVRLMNYYQDPAPEIVPDALKVLDAHDAFKPGEKSLPWIVFFSHVFAQNPERQWEWSVVIRGLSEDAQSALNKSIEQSANPDEILLNTTHSPSLNDSYWLGFFATGKKNYVLRVVEEASLSTDRQNLNRFMAGASAKWSLSSNYRQHPKVKEIIDAAMSSAAGDKKELLKEVVAQTPEEINKQTLEIVKKGNEAGTWWYGG